MNNSIHGGSCLITTNVTGKVAKPITLTTNYITL